jgi:hypothetical protein
VIPPELLGSAGRQVGELVRNEAPQETGEEGDRYIVVGWVLTKDGWEEVRCLTGN